VIRPLRIVLTTDQSEALRDRLVAELSDLKSADEAADWAHNNLPAKNTLAPVDAETVEANFRERLATVEGGQVSATAANANTLPGDEPSREQSRAFDSPETPAPETTVVRRRRVAAKPIRLRDKDHRKFVASQPCIVCGRTPSEAHHIRFAQPRALGRKVSDEYTVPVCRVHHRDLHRYGDEASWWAGVGIDPLLIALELWRRSRLTYSLAATWSEPLSDVPVSSGEGRAGAVGRRQGTGVTRLNILMTHPQKSTSPIGLSHARNLGLGGQDSPPPTP
jgi:hypothetical protein